jgi:hypothetical protein
MRVPARVYRFTDRPMTWTRAILLGSLIWIAAILLLGQAPSVIIYKFDQYVAEIINVSKRIPGVGNLCHALGSGLEGPSDGCNATQIAIFRDIVANTIQNVFLIGALVGTYIWQERKRKRVGGRGVQDVVKGYMSGK